MNNVRTKADDAVAALVPPPGDLIDGDRVDALMRVAAHATPRELLVAATEAVTPLLGQRGSCILVEGGPRVAFAPHAPGLVDWPVNLKLYPEVVAAVESRAIIAIEDVHSDARLEAVRGNLPRELGSVAVVPLVVADRCLGVFLVQSAAAQTVSPQAKATAALLAKITALVLSKSPPLLAPVAAEADVARRSIPPSPAVELQTNPESPGCILIIDDDEAFVSVLSTSLIEEGYRVEHTTNGDDGLRRIAAIRPQMVLLDVNLPSLNGFDIARLLRSTPVYGNVPILFLSGADDLALRVRGIRLSDVDFLPKPFSIDELLTRIQRVGDQAAARRKLLLEAEHDELTGLGNLRLLRTRMVAERSRFQRYGSALTLVVVDVDKLKQINDHHGHVAGSRALKAIADVLRKEVRETDLPIRYGGDEFVVLLPHTTLGEGLAFANRALAHIAEIKPGGIPVTVSIGIAALAGNSSSDDDLLRRADAAAYRAKRLGGNRVCADEDDSRPV